MTETETARFPFINLEKAVARARQLFSADQQGRPMLVHNAFLAWQYSPKSSGGFQTISALKLYGLINDTGANEGRKVQLTPEGRRYFIDEREGERMALLKTFATTPKLLKAVWAVWGARPPADNIARSELQLEWKLQEQSARSFLGIYKDNLAFAELSDQGSMPPVEERPAPSNRVTLDGQHRPARLPPIRPTRHQEEQVAEGERVVFSEEAGRAQYLKLVASGEIDDAMLRALESYVQRQRARLADTAKRDTFDLDDQDKPRTPT